MLKRIQSLIEDDIQEIEREDWYSVFYDYYHYWATFDTASDKVQLEELFDVLRHAYDQILSRTFEARKVIVQDAMLEYISARASNSQAVTANYNAALDHLNSRLYLDSSTLRKLFTQAAESLGYDMDKHSLVVRLK